MLRGVLAAFEIPPVIVVVAGTILNGPAKIMRMKGHAVLTVDVVDRHPPVDLAHGRGIPRVTMRMKCVGDTRFQIIARKRSTHTRNIKVSLREIATQFGQYALNVFLGIRMVNEFGLQNSQDFGRLFSRDVVMNAERIVWLEGLFDHALRQLAKFQGIGRRGMGKDRALIKLRAALIVTHFRINVDIHSDFTSLFARIERPFRGCTTACFRHESPKEVTRLSRIEAIELPKLVEPKGKARADIACKTMKKNDLQEGSPLWGNQIFRAERRCSHLTKRWKILSTG